MPHRAKAYHIQPKGLDPSPFLMAHLPNQNQVPNAPIVDVACGFGRNAFYMAEQGYEVHALDNSSEALKVVENLLPCKGKILTQNIDLECYDWPYGRDALAGVVNVHYFNSALIKEFSDSIMPNGFLLIETIDNRGGNYQYLPKENFIRDVLGDNFELLFYQEKKAGPDKYNAVTLKLFARKFS